MDALQGDNEETQGSGESVVSNLSALENETDDFGRRLLQHQRNVQRLNASRLPLLKGKVGHRRVDMSPRASPERPTVPGLEHGRTGSSGSTGSDPPLNVPRDWGRKAGKRRPDWQRRVDHQELPATGQRSGMVGKEGAIVPRRTAYTGDKSPFESQHLGGRAMQSIETPPPPRTNTWHIPTPSSMDHMNTTINGALDIDDQDFSAASLLTSTPAVNRRNRKIDELTRREIEVIERRRITKRTLEHLTATTITEERPVTAPAAGVAYGHLGQQSNLLSYDKENIQPPNGRQALKTIDARNLSRRSAQTVTFKNSHKPSHLRSDSYNLLKQLARVTSMSPSPGKNRLQGTAAISLDNQGPDASPIPSKRRASLENAGDIGGAYETAIEAEASIAEGTRDTKQQNALGNADDVAAQRQRATEMTPASKENHVDTKTPVVAGAWPDTPAPAANVKTSVSSTHQEGAKGNVSSVDSDEYNLQRTRSEPSHPKSALTDILAEARKDKDTLFGESTFASLEDIANPNADATDPTETLDLGDSTQELADRLDMGYPLTQAEKDRRQETLAMEAMEKSLRHAQTSIKDASRGLRRVENKIETAQEPISSRPGSKHQTSIMTAPLQKSDNRFSRTQCAHCGGRYTSVWRGLLHEFTDCFYTYSAHETPQLQLTKLGLFCVLALVWYATESIFCYNYCRQKYAYSMIGTGVNPDAPEFPFVIPTLLFHPFKFLWEPLGAYLSWLGGVVFEWAIGDVSTVPYNPATFVGSAPAIHVGEDRGRWRETTQTLSASRAVQWMTATTAAVGDRAIKSAIDAVDEVGRIWDDEYSS